MFFHIYRNKMINRINYKKLNLTSIITKNYSDIPILSLKISFMLHTFLSILIFFISNIIISQSQDTRWQLTENNGTTWTISGSKLPHTDNIEMSGRKVSGIVSYTVDKNQQLYIEREIIFPQIHPYIKDSDPDWFIYRSYLKKKYSDDILPKFYVENKQFSPGKIKKININGFINFEHEPNQQGIVLHRKLFPSPSTPAFLEALEFTNTTNKTISIAPSSQRYIHKSRGSDGEYQIIMEGPVTYDGKSIILPAKKSVVFYVRISCTKESTNISGSVTPKLLSDQRNTFLQKMKSNLILETPNPILNLLFEFSKIRASESIFDSKLGPIHSPGGGRYYVGIWANDQAEYVSPLFPYLNYELGNESAYNCYKAFNKVKSPDFKPIQYAFEVETLSPPSPLDRGDAAMIAYGASQYLLARGNLKEAKEMWPLVKWCLDYNHLKLNDEGVVISESDEMEGRIETGKANLSTSSLYYGALTNAIYLGKELDISTKEINTYKTRQEKLKMSIESYFGARTEGLDTYKYYKEHTYLRHWIALPLVVDINKRKDATIEALLERLWTENGVHVEKNSSNSDISQIFWDRGTLYALRGTFRAGATNKSLKHLVQFSKKRLLGERVPYVVEAFPEGDMAHLSAESGLYCRIFTEGLFAITPTSFNSFNIQPRLPKNWNEMALRHVRLYGKDIDIEVKRAGIKTHIRIIDANSKKTYFDKKVTLDKPISVLLD